MLLFITRKYPPSVGGMQKYSHELATTLFNMAEVKLVKWSGSQLFLPWFILQALFLSIVCLISKPVKVIQLGDGLLLPLGWVLKKISQKPVIATLHGLDLTFPFRPYQWVISFFINKVDRLICISDRTKLEALKRGAREENIVIIPNGILLQNGKLTGNENESTHLLERITGCKLQGKKVLLTVGRLVERKGVDYFISQIFPKILKHRDDVIYLVIGDGKFKGTIEKTISKGALQDKVFLLGRVSDSILKASYQCAHVFVMPNIPVKGDMEGFGLVALEASLAGLPVVASKLEGICDAIVHGQNGMLVDYRDHDTFSNTILDFLNFEEKRKEFGINGCAFTSENYAWDRIGRKYLKVFQSLDNV